MARSSSSRLKFLTMPESARGTIPSSALQIARITGIRKKASKQSVQSDELRIDRQITSFAEVGQAANLGLDVEWSYGTFDEWLAGLLFNAWTTPVTVTGSSNISFTSGTKKITQSGASFDTQFLVGQILRVKGTTNNGSNSVPKFFTITALSATEITVAETLTTENNTSAVLYTCCIRNWFDAESDGGFVDKSYTAELEPTDLSSIFANQRGMTFNTLDLNIASRQKITGQFGLMGLQFATATATVGTGSATAATTTDILNATSNVAALMKDGAAFANAVRDLRLQFSNNLYELPAVGQKYAVDINPGQFAVTGNFNPYFEDKAMLDAFINHTETALRIDVQDSAGNRQIISLPSVYFGGGDAGPEATANNQPTSTQLPLQCRRHPTMGFTVQISRFPAS